jgi:DHA1 family bicyclomycin/chloramphenicol resistance-like MFS transporter
MPVKRYFTIIVVTSMMSLMFSLSLDIIFPSLPVMAKIFGVNDSTIQLTVPCYLLGYAFSQLVYGALSDRYGRRPVFFAGTAIYILGGIGCLLSRQMTPFLIGRLIQGLGAGASGLLARVVLRDSFEGERMAEIMSYVSSVIIVGISLAPVLGGFIQDTLGYRGNLGCMLGYGILVMLVGHLWLPETNRQRTGSLHATDVLATYKRVLLTKGFLSYATLTSLGFTTVIAYSAYNPFFFQEHLGYTPARYGVMALVIAGGEFVGTTLNGRLVARWGGEKMIVIGLLLAGSAGIALLGLNATGISTAGILVPSIIAAIGTGFIISNAISFAYSKFKDSIGAAGAIFGFCQVNATVVCTYAISRYCAVTPSFLAGILMLIFLSGCILLYGDRERADEVVAGELFAGS